MPTDWQYHADGVRTAVTTKHRLDGSLRKVSIQLDSFKVREWTEDESEIEAAGKNLQNMHYDEEIDAYVEHSDGAHATLVFSVSDGEATLSGIKPEDGERVEPRHMTLLSAAERIVEQLEGVDVCMPPLETLANEYHNAGDIHIETLDG